MVEKEQIPTELEIIQHPYLVFFKKEVQGDCLDPNQEFGNLHRKTLVCKYWEKDGCHYSGKCVNKSKG